MQRLSSVIERSTDPIRIVTSIDAELVQAPDQKPWNDEHLQAGEGIDGPLFLGMDTHALSEPAHNTALAVFAANGLAGADGAQGVMGIQHFERGLMWVETFMSGHMQPEFQPRSSYRHLQWLLGRTDEI